MPNNGGRVTTREHFEAIMDVKKDIADMETRLTEKITDAQVDAATDRTAVKSLLRRDTIGYVWDSFNTIAATIVIALYWGRN